MVEFPFYLERRHWLWFRAEHQNIHSRAECQKPLPEDCSLDDFKCCPFWQRKLSNKWNARLLAQKLGARVPDLYWYGTSSQIDQIPFETFPNHYVIKPTSAWSCLGVFVMKHGVNLFDGKHYSVSELRKAIKKIAKQFPRSRFMVEEMVTDENGEYKIPIDFKCHLFGSQLESILAIRRRDGHSGWAAFYDRHWNHKGGAKNSEPTIHIAPYKPEIIKAPKCLEEMVEIAETIGRFYGSFVRVDFYATKKGCVFGEFTPFPNAGGNYNPFSDRWLSAWKKLDPLVMKSQNIGDGQIKLNGVKSLKRPVFSERSITNRPPVVKKMVVKKHTPVQGTRKLRTFSVKK